MYRLILCLSLALGGCAITHVDADGTTRVIGFVDMTVPANESASEDPAGSAVSVTALGLSVFRTPHTTAVSLGYSSQSEVRLRDDALVLGRPF